MERFRIIKEKSTDKKIFFEANGKDLKEVFKNAGFALLSVICDRESLEAEQAEEFEMDGSDAADTMFIWLSGIVAVANAESMCFSKVEIEEMDEKHIKAKLWGEPKTAEKAGRRVEAILQEGYSFENDQEGYSVKAALILS
ncbi:hypothetical protein GF351_03215 [Candidatus Woesearchaeota archaeon]|nr:hypothetical protein [Candidatus Woesearchaeota archaeon]